jgi:hypothetical protein
MDTGAVLLITAEMQGDIFETTKEHDFEAYEELQNVDINKTDFITIEYGTYSKVFNNHKSCIVDLETKQLKVDYYTQAEIDEINNNIPLSAEQLLEQDNANLLIELVQKDILINQLQGGV